MGKSLVSGAKQLYGRFTRRGICLIVIIIVVYPSCAYKVFSRIRYKKLLPFPEQNIGKYQMGFMSGKSTIDQIFSIRSILQRWREYDIHTHHLFIDFRMACDSTKRNELYQELLEMGIPLKLIRLRFKRKILRRIYGSVCINEIWRIRMNAELTRFYKSPDILRVIKVGRLRWADLIIRMTQDQIPKMVLDKRIYGTRPQLRRIDGVVAEMYNK